MAYTPDMPAAARRHIEAADALADGPRCDVAGYLYGIAAECAFKAMMLDTGTRPSNNRRDGPFYAHFPELQTMLREEPLGRRGAVLRRFIENDAFMNQWDTRMRYCKGSDIRRKWIVEWKAQAHDVVDCIGT